MTLMTHMAQDMLCYFDGACEPRNPGGNGGWGFVIQTTDGIEVSSGCGFMPARPDMTNNVAEYTAALMAIHRWLEHTTTDVLIMRGDSKLVVEQMAGRWQVNSGAYVPVYRELRALVDLHQLHVEWEWIPRAQNTRADLLSHTELKARGIRCRY
jgi:ribonuclease HI